jgi:hypothetical protein
MSDQKAIEAAISEFVKAYNTGDLHQSRITETISSKSVMALRRKQGDQRPGRLGLDAQPSQGYAYAAARKPHGTLRLHPNDLAPES